MRDHDRFFSPRAHLLDDKPLPPVEPGTDYYTTTEMADRWQQLHQQFERQATTRYGEP